MYQPVTVVSTVAPFAEPEKLWVTIGQVGVASNALWNKASRKINGSFLRKEAFI